MTDLWIAPERLFDGQTVAGGQAVRIVDGHVAEVGKASAEAIRIKGCLSPGFIDLQVNGGGGVMVNTTPTAAGMGRIAAAHRGYGTVAILPTVITDSAQVLEKAADAAIAAKNDAGILGLHIEGPHIAAARRGTHDPAHIRPMDARTMALVARLRAEGVTVMLTLAPEAVQNAQIADLAKMGVIVSVGHTDASADDVERAIAAGARCATHVFNAMSQMTSRAPGAVGAVLNAPIHAGIICDGHHVDDRMIQLALRARPADDLTFLVSDAMATVGGPDRFDLYGQTVQLENGRLINAEGHLAGAHFTQAQGVARLVQQLGISLDQALRMAISIPAHVIGQDRLAGLEGRALRDLLILDKDAAVSATLADVYAMIMAGAH